MELPPRARRIPPHPHIHATSLGTTSACAENTRKPHRLEFPAWNYLRVRGEYNWPVSSVGLSVELPPRARRIRKTNTTNKDYAGTTSACAENTSFAPSQAFLRKELPPRARRILLVSTLAWACSGTTSACAENTCGRSTNAAYTRNYLRVRGEYSAWRGLLGQILELPPRARRILKRCGCLGGGVGTTSACAENTAHCLYHLQARWNYLRVRGEYGAERQKSCPPLELPPRARRIRLGPISFATSHGTTSACAENTLNELGLL